MNMLTETGKHYFCNSHNSNDLKKEIKNMTFLEALKELHEGRCKGIKSPTGCILVLEEVSTNTRGRLKINGAANNLQSGALTFRAEIYLSEGWSIVNPVKQTEKTEVVKYMTQGDSGYFYTDTPIKESSVKLIGVIEKEIKPKVKKRKQIGKFDSLGVFAENVIVGIPNAKVFAEWEE